jgi:uncharacterized NAD(P)/FAD-binding protein YdhS
MATLEPDPTVPKTFISYSWDDDAHKEWVKRLAIRLRTDGVNVTLDRWHSAPGDQIPAFMDRAVRENDFVIAICTPRFKEKSDGRSGGVGYEGDIMTAYAFTSGAEKKFIPVLRCGSWGEAAPTSLLGRAKVDLSGDPYSESEYLELLRTLHGAREEAPPIGNRPDFKDKKGSQASPPPAPVTPHEGSSTLQHQSSVTPPKEAIRSNGTPPVIGIVGMGFAGTTTAIRLMELASVPIKLVVFERHPVQMFGGVAYGASGVLREHCLNIHAGRISMFRERPDDFLKWATEDADRSEWFEKLNITKEEKPAWEQRFTFTEFSAVPRLLYQLYLRDRFQQASELAAEKRTVTVERISACVHDLDERNDYVRLHYIANGSQRIIDVDIAILSTGQLEPLLPAFTDEIKGHASFFSQPYDLAFIQRISKSTKSDGLLIVGSGLMAFDAAQSAAEVGFKGKITMCSRNRHRHDSYPYGHSHMILPPIFAHLFKGVTTAKEMRAAIDKAISEAPQQYFARYLFPREFHRVIPERVLKAIEPQVAHFVQTAPVEEVREFLSYRSWITTMRTSVVPEVARRVRDSGVSEVTRTIVSITAQNDGDFSVKFANDEKYYTYTTIVCCMGYNPDYQDARGLWGSVMKKIGVHHKKTGLGIEVGANGRVMRSWDKTMSRSLYAVGTMRQGDEIERRGRLGGFTFSIGTIRNQCLMAALSILRSVESPEYRKLANAEHLRDKREIENQISNQDSGRRKYNALVARIADAQFLANTKGRDDWVNFLKHQLCELINTREKSEKEKQMIEYELWHTARKKAGILVTDIRRLSERYEIVRAYRPGKQSECVAEKKECKDQLKKLMDSLNARSVSLSVYLNNTNCLHPFVDYLRLNNFTPTPYGQNNAGRLVKAFTKRIAPDCLYSKDFFPDPEITPYYFNGRMVGMIILDYNKTLAKKEIYDDDSPRLYSHVLLALVLDEEERVLGVIFLDATAERRFQISDVEDVFRRMRDVSSLLSDVVKKWEPRGGDLDCQDQNLPGLVVEYGRDMCRGNFTNANLEGAKFNGVKSSTVPIVKMPNSRSQICQRL